MAELNVNLVSREGQIWEGTATQVVAPSVSGSVGILPGRVPLLAALDNGKVTVDTTAGKRLEFNVYGGFISVDANQVEVVVERSEHISGIN